MEEPLLQALSDKFQMFSYPPNSLMLAQGTTCDEVLILISGQVQWRFISSKIWRTI